MADFGAAQHLRCSAWRVSFAAERETANMTPVYDDNFGFWDLKEPEEQVFFDHVQSQSLPTICRRCERPVRLMPTKTLCASCISALESGAPASISEY